MPKTIAIIPARAGSKRLPGKNKRMLCEKPLIAWTIDEVLRVKGVDEIRITTDDIDIIEYCSRRYKCFKRVRIILRPDELATDEAPMIEVVRHATSDLGLLDVILLLQPTTPLRNVSDIRGCLSLYDPNRPYRVISAYREDFYTFKLNGACYVLAKRALDVSDKIVGDEPIVLYMMPKERSTDIDYLEEFRECEEILKKR